MWWQNLLRVQMPYHPINSSETLQDGSVHGSREYYTLSAAVKCGWCCCVQLRNEKSELEGTLAREQEHQMEKLLKHIERLQNEVSSKQETLDQVNLISSEIVPSFCMSH